LSLSSNRVVAVKTGTVLAGVAQFGWLLVTHLTDGGKVSVHMLDALKCSCGGKFDTIVEDGASQFRKT
jgi:hypothetical protein